MPDAPPEVKNSAPANVADDTVGGPAQKATWSERAPLLKAIEHWDSRLAQRLSSIMGARWLMLDEYRVASEKHPHREWGEAVALLKEKTKSDGGYVLQVLDIGQPFAELQIASDQWIDSILPREVSFADSQILRNQIVFGAWVISRQPELEQIPERGRRTVDKGGRPAKFRWDEFWFEVCRIANTPDGLPDQREFNKHMLDWASKHWSDPPADSTIRNKISELYRALGCR